MRPFQGQSATRPAKDTEPKPPEKTSDAQLRRHAQLPFGRSTQFNGQRSARASSNDTRCLRTAWNRANANGRRCSFHLQVPWGLFQAVPQWGVRRYPRFIRRSKLLKTISWHPWILTESHKPGCTQRNPPWLCSHGSLDRF